MMCSPYAVPTDVGRDGVLSPRECDQPVSRPRSGSSTTATWSTRASCADARTCGSGPGARGAGGAGGRAGRAVSTARARTSAAASQAASAVPNPLTAATRYLAASPPSEPGSTWNRNWNTP
jgi:hypothetical protein